MIGGWGGQDGHKKFGSLKLREIHVKGKSGKGMKRRGEEITWGNHMSE